MRKNYRNANGDGCITKVKNNKKNPFRVRVTDIKTGKRESLGYYDSKSKAKEVLRTYLYNPYDLKFRTITFKELFELFKENKKEVVAETTFKSYINSYKRCKPLYNLIFKDISTPQMQNMINKLDCSIATKNITKGFLKIFWDYAREIDILEKNRAEFINLPKETEIKEKNPFNYDEIEKLWENKDIIWVKFILIMIYTGMRIEETVELKKENVDLQEGFIHGGNKTKKGKNRSIPIHKDIFEIAKELYENSPTDYLIYNDKWIFSKKKNENKPLRKNYFREKFYETLETLKINKHKPHDCRKTLATLMSNQKINNIVITDIMGHENIATTKQYYIQTDKQKLKLSMNSLNFRKTS
jgi:putative integrase-recombinase protein